MGPADLLCKWCSTFVGKDKKFCSIFCESRYTRSKRRKLAFKRPAHSSGPHADREYESPRSHNTAPSRKFLEDVITAVETEKPSPERDRRLDGNPNVSSPATEGSQTTPRSDKNLQTDSLPIPKLDLTTVKTNNDENTRKGSDKQKLKPDENIKPVDKAKTDLKTKPRYKDIKKSPRSKAKGDLSIDKSKTQTLLIHKNGLKIPVADKSLLNKSIDASAMTAQANNISSDDKKIKQDLKTRKLTNLNDRIKLTATKGLTDLDIIKEAKERQKSKLTHDYEKNVRSSGYGNPINPRLRPLALKPKSASVVISSSKLQREQRQISARSNKSDTDSIPLSARKADKRLIGNEKNDSQWELVPTTIIEEPPKHEQSATGNLNKSLEDEVPTPRMTNRLGLTQIREIEREGSATSVVPGKTELEIRLSSIKRKVEVKKRGRDSRSSFGSDLDASFLDSTLDLTTDRDVLNRTKTSRNSARSNITKISKQFRN
ncbi:uncharacterized protein LOC128219568 isoform X1 [Mya arenaria]|uniref:uncharacterized protein LOC128219568 isoform X1 n=1 Tax=Mya arenaria TaxID=6604 RepID=UPI0022DEBF82|nr:uncharacterized protein LOC128219568 isoform X1 [Mya arenaria]